MRRSTLSIVALVALILCAPVRAQNGQTLAFDLFRDYLESLRVQAGSPGLAATIVGLDGVLWEHPFGRQDLAHSIATRTDTPFHADGLTEVFTASMVLRCVEEGRLSLDDRVSAFKDDSTEPNATIWQLLTHTSGPIDNLTFAYRPDRLEPLASAIRACTEDSYRETLANLLGRFAMVDSVPGADIIKIVPPAEGVPDPSDVDRYTRVLQRVATSYAVDAKGRTVAAVAPATSTITPSSGLISTVRDLARFDLALRQGLIIDPATLQAAWRTPVDATNQAIPHGLGWFVQTYNGELVVWQFGLNENASSSLMITLPARGLTLILMANSDRLVKPLPLAAGDVTVSPFARLFISLFAR